MERPGRVFSRTQLLDMVWGHGVFVEERTVDVHISRLRKAISVSQQNGATAPNLIYSIRGSGYALRQPHDVS
jgi:two-component system phosphate regulon response regulator PhoB